MRTFADPLLMGQRRAYLPTPVQIILHFLLVHITNLFKQIYAIQLVKGMLNHDYYKLVSS